MDGADADVTGETGDRADDSDRAETPTGDPSGTDYSTGTDGARPEGPPATLLDRAEELTPMLSQYLDLCRAHPDAVVLFQVGDFYEAFCEAAETVARVCEVTLTQREDSTGTYPMAGIPIDNAASYLEVLLDADYRVAIADQVEDAEAASGLVDRAVTNVVSPGTVVDDDLLDRASATYLAGLVERDPGQAARDNAGSDDSAAALATLDVSTGECRVTAESADRIREELERLAPAEVVVDSETSLDASVLGFETMVTERDPAVFGLGAAEATLSGYVAEPAAVLDAPIERRAVGGLLSYAEYTQGDDGALPYVSRVQRYHLQESLRLDATAMRSLELFESRQPGGGGTLVGTVDRTVSALGRRRLESWLRRPLVDATRIDRRHDAVAELLDRPIAREAVREHLASVYDLERLAARIAQERADARDLRSLRTTLAVVPELNAALDDAESAALRDLRASLDGLADVRDLIERAIVPDPPQEITEGGVVCEGFDSDLDEVRAAERAGREWVSSLEERERERTGIDSLEVGYTQVHGYYIEVTDPNLDRVPDDYTRRQTLKNAERYYTPELKRREEEILSASERADSMEYGIFREVRSRVAGETERLQSLADALARLDTLATFAAVAADAGYVRPTVGAETLRIDAGRHPVVERTQDEFVPNGIDFTAGRVAVITGPNMSGKSTYMRQVALICLLAQAGSFVPADAAELPVLDRIFTRVGASDDIAGGQSTFMREMSELTDILHDATEDSLVLLDEVGRGTSTADGLAIARAATEFIHDDVGAATLFATHYHDLTDLATELPNAFNRHFTVNREGGGTGEKERSDTEVTFLHRVADGPASSSYGVEVAKLAGVPDRVVKRAREYVRGADGEAIRGADGDAAAATRSATSDGGSDTQRGSGSGADPASTAQPDRGDTLTAYVEGLENGDHDGSGDGAGEETHTGAERDVLDALRDADIARTTPLEALNTLEDLQRRLDE
ncbi:DNA mismatch repair protein MutS [Halobellus salinus]|uniref:DNA mismatch repair protein MutS n=1 Tax=Halobellus salinus TaxID=931585 RepID=A0A830EGS8_9EURY|nr:DNA mismatch repair protein MutS [Halobellus salinus]GGJ08479.1 DNA mismatch repair protein MutS [Halobellus salinus]SMP28227.1 DNA mismatch repair protein MutS [Halobellus salinus]